MNLLLTLFEHILDRAMLSAELAREWLDDRRRRRAIANTKAAIDALGRPMAPVVRARPMIDRRRVIAMPRQSVRSVRLH